ncbi:MAG: hypothetical protein NDJ94_06705 [Vicinamibacteria bacterium]|nr:hypothetical protein [Vicinamibacteria bacterium]
MCLRSLFGLLLAVALFPSAAAFAQSRDDARPRDLQRLEEDLANLDAQLAVMEQGPDADRFRARAEEIREETIYLKVKARNHQRSGRDGTGLGYDEVQDVRGQVADLLVDIDEAFGTPDAGRSTGRPIVLPAGTQIQVRLDHEVSSLTARMEDRIEASVQQPLREGGLLVISAGTRIRGIVREVEPAQRPSKSGRLVLEFDAFYLDRERLDMRGTVAAVGGPAEDRAKKAGIGAVVGGILGGILGGSEGAVVGAILGGGGAVVASKGEDVTLPAGTELTVRLERPLTLPAQR